MPERKRHAFWQMGNTMDEPSPVGPEKWIDVSDSVSPLEWMPPGFLQRSPQTIRVQRIEFVSRSAPWRLRLLALVAVIFGQRCTRLTFDPWGQKVLVPCYLLGHRLFIWEDDCP